jgi:hypothetical protein
MKAQARVQADKFSRTNNLEEFGKLNQVLTQIKGMVLMPFSIKQQVFFDRANHKGTSKSELLELGKHTWITLLSLNVSVIELINQGYLLLLE